MIFWTKTLLEEIRKEIETSNSVSEAVAKWNKKTGNNVTPNAVNKAFMRHLNCVASSFLRVEKDSGFDEDEFDPEIEADEDDEDDDFDSSNFYSDSNAVYVGDYVFVYTPKRLFKFSKKMYEGMHFDYSNQAPGGASTINEICKKWKIRRKYFVAVKNSCGWTHDNDPYTEGQHVKHETDALVADLIQKKRAEFEKKFRRKELDQMKKDASEWRKAKYFFGEDFSPDKINNKIASLFEIKNFCDNYTHILKEPKKFPISRTSCGLIIPVSDLHAGKTFKTSNPNFSNINKDVLRARKEKIMKYIEMASEASYDFINYVSLGDDFESLFGNMRNGQLMTMDMHSLAQYRFVLEFHIDILKTIQKSFPDIPITATFQGGNHDRLFESKDWNSENFMVAIMVDRIYQEFKDNSNMNFLVGEAVLSQVLPNGLNLITQHGHQSSVLDEKAVNNFIMVHGEKNAERHFVLQGHYHKFLYRTGTNSHYMINGSICGNDEYNTSKLNLTSYPEFAMIRTTGTSEYILGPYNLEKTVDFDSILC